MSCYYVCDVCNKNITASIARINIAIQKSGEQTKMIKHACNSCYVKHLQPLLNGNLAIIEEQKELAANQDAVQNVVKDDTKEQKQVVEKVEEKTVENVPVELPKFDQPQVTRRSKYFTEKNCFNFHRMILIGAKPMAMAKSFGIEYQMIRNYANSFDKSVAEGYQPINPISELERICKDFKKQLPKVKALTATCTWSTKDIAGETDIPERDIIIYFEDIPWFENNFFNKVVIEEED